MRKVVVFICCVAAVPAIAATRPAALVTAITACKGITADPARLACYDAAVGDLAAAQTKGDVRVVDREDVRATRRSLFGFALPKLPLFGGDDSADATPETVDTVIRDVRGDGYGRYTLAMEDGATWKTIEPMTREPRPGDKVHLKTAALGSYFMSIAGGRGVRITRTR